MEDIPLALARDVPSLAVLVIFVILTGRQFSTMTDHVAKHLDQINKLLEKCMDMSKAKANEASEESVRDILRDLLKSQRDLISRLDEYAKTDKVDQTNELLETLKKSTSVQERLLRKIDKIN